jgi:hypothetical protein
VFPKPAAVTLSKEPKPEVLAESIIEKYRNDFLVSGDSEADYGIEIPRSIPEHLRILLKETGFASVFRENGWEGPREALTDDIANWVVTEYGILVTLAQGREECDAGHGFMGEVEVKGKSQQQLYEELKEKYDLQQ